MLDGKPAYSVLRSTGIVIRRISSPERGSSMFAYHDLGYTYYADGSVGIITLLSDCRSTWRRLDFIAAIATNNATNASFERESLSEFEKGLQSRLQAKRLDTIIMQFGKEKLAREAMKLNRESVSSVSSG